VSIDNKDVSDAIGVETASGKVVLSISDHFDWSEEDAHLLALQNKINTYLRFIEGGELLTTYPQSAGRQRYSADRLSGNMKMTAEGCLTDGHQVRRRDSNCIAHADVGELVGDGRP
jgi:hypothetical protein